MKGWILVGFACAASLVAARAAPAKSACLEQVITDWSAHSRVEGQYSAGCYRQALAKMPEDLRTYSSAPGDIRRALQSRLTSATAAAQPLAANGHERGRGQLVLFAAVLVAVVALAIVAIR